MIISKSCLTSSLSSAESRKFPLRLLGLIAETLDAERHHMPARIHSQRLVAVFHHLTVAKDKDAGPVALGSSVDKSSLKGKMATSNLKTVLWLKHIKSL